MSSQVERVLKDLATESAELGEPLYRRLVGALRLKVEDGALPIGSRLPSERTLAKMLGISRTTVQSAYRELESLGYLQPRRGSGTFVRGRPEWPSPVAAGRSGWPRWRRQSPGDNSFLLDLMQAASERHRYGFETGVPDPKLMPVRAFKTIIEDLFSQQSPEWVSYSPTPGIPQLRHALTQTLLPLRGLNGVRPEEVLVLTGSMQGLDLIGKAWLGPGDTVLVENPTFPGAIQIFRSFGARLVGVPMDRHGVVVEALVELLEHARPKLLYVQPTLQNPTGAILAARRRAALLEAATRADVLVVEDDAYGLLVHKDAPPPLKALDEQGRVLYLSTVSKIVSPGLRLGYLVAEERLVRELAYVKQLTDLHTSTVSQFLVEGWLSTGDVHGHIKTCRDVYRQRLAQALTVLSARPTLRPWLEPEDGFYIFCRLPAGLTAARLRAESVHRGVIYASGDAFSVDGGLADHLRLCVSSCDGPTIQAGLERLQRLAEALAAEA